MHGEIDDFLRGLEQARTDSAEGRDRHADPAMSAAFRDGYVSFRQQIFTRPADQWH